MREVYAVPGRAEAVAIVDRPHPYPPCDVTVVLLLSRKPLPIREHDLSQEP